MTILKNTGHVFCRVFLDLDLSHVFSWLAWSCLICSPNPIPKSLATTTFLSQYFALLKSLAQLCPTLCNPVDYSPPGSCIHGILQARILEWVAISFSRGSFWPRDRTQVSCIAGRVTWEARMMALQRHKIFESEVKVKLLSCVWLFATPWTIAHQAPPSMGFSRQEYWSGLP